MSLHKRSFLESPRFPTNEIDKVSAVEKRGGGRPEIWEMVFWWTRKPLISARSLIAGAVLPEDTDVFEFKRIVGLLSSRVPHRENPKVPRDLKDRLKSVRLLDPFAGFGSIPLEAVRLGIGEVVAVELLPAAYVFLKAVLEIPKWLAESGLSNRLLRDLEHWSEYIVEMLSRDPDLRDVYGEDTDIYIGTWEVRCSLCGRYTSLVGNWWLARVKSGEGYERLVWMEPSVSDDKIEIKVHDLNEVLGKRIIKAKVDDKRVSIGDMSWRVPEPNVLAKRGAARCLYGNHALPGSRDEWRVREALREWNNKLEKYLCGEITLGELRSAAARPRLLAKAKVVDGYLKFEPVTEEDNERLWIALEKLRNAWGDPDAPIEKVAEYETRSVSIVTYGFDKWFKLYNPRQLLTLIKLVKLIREVGKVVEEDMSRELSLEDAFKYAQALTTYLAIILANYVRHNCYVTSVEPTRKLVTHALAFRGLCVTWNWVEVPPAADVVGSFTRSARNALDGVRYLVEAVSDSPSRVTVVLDDARELSKVEGKFDLIVTDPPYLDDVPYSELSDFYYVWLKRALSNNDGRALMPKFFREAFYECLDDECSRHVEIKTQWEVFAKCEISVRNGRAKYFGGPGSVKSFKDGLTRAFRRMSKLLKDDGVLVTYYAHTSPEAWEALLEAGWRSAGLTVSKTFTIATEDVKRVVARGKVALDSSVVIVWRRGSSGVALLEKVRSDALKEATKAVEEFLRSKGFILDIILFLESLSSVLRIFTTYSELISKISKVDVSALVKAYIFPIAVQALVNGLGVSIGVQGNFSPVSSAYIATKTIFKPKSPVKFGRVTVDRNFVSILGAISGIDNDELIARRVFKESGERIELLEPSGVLSLDEASIRKSIRDLLAEKSINLKNPVFETPIDVLHYLEYSVLELGRDEFVSLVDNLKSRGVQVEEALNVARVFARALPQRDPEKVACSKILSRLGELGLWWSR